jgi:LuxR family maltose regulon positive regulatory protein
VRAFSSSHRDVLYFLTEEVLYRQPEGVRSFLLETSLLDRLTDSLCDAVTWRFDWDRMLKALERDNLFVIPLDDDRRWYRYHHLFADFLHGRLQRRCPERVPELHRRAAMWYEREGWISEVIGYALAAEDDEWAARLIEQDAQALILRSGDATLDRYGLATKHRRWPAD